ncbi:winged helix-turn-helix transcriptional regulator [Polycladomyces sp. WAk]|uniref:Winged helix-turn-helix transcriptional regulator n=1 Tax=Polycladomyces zharkentensis TaxID=2807616 RepID=A0ABS2WF12_9BACL|nr:winged helix-turn-helix transcriptional regulator [Polycladomyces sp. WAk]MBN2908122.1 winged helix-turn-helix transcriptional regulator [Polycladomyces sp. WAk]
MHLLEGYEDQCRALTTLETIIGKWKAIILLHLLRGGTKRFSELQKLIPEITKRMLTLQLRDLEEEDIIKRVVYPQVPPKVEYSITDHGRTLEPILEEMHDWGNKHLDHIRNKNAQVHVSDEV